MADRHQVRGERLRRILLFVVVLACCSAAPVLAQSPSESPLPESAPAEAGGNDPVLEPPRGADVAEGIIEAERKEVERDEWLASPAAVQEREGSRLAFTSLSANDAEMLIERVFADFLEALDSDPARFLSDAQLIRPLGAGETAGVVRDEGDSSLMDAGIPVRTEDESGDLAKVDLSLKAAGEGWETANALTDVVIPKSADAALQIGEDGVSVTQVGASDGGSGRLLGGESVYFHEAMPDVGTIAAPVSGGAELFDVLFSERSPERFEFDLDLPHGAVLQPDRFGGAEVTREGETVGYVRFPTAVDAQGTQVPVDLRVEGDTIAIEIKHRDQDLAYPLLLDPEFVWENWYTANWWNGYGLAALTDGTWQPYASVPWIIVQSWPYYSTFGGSNRGLFLHGNSGTWDANRFGQYSYTVPDWDSYIDHSSLLPFWRDDHGCGYKTYPQPHDYVGHWDGAQWIGPVKINEARTLGYSNLGQWGKMLIIGIGSGNGGPNPCARDVYVGGVGVWLDDWSQPALWTYPTAQWMDATPNRQNVLALDIGLGVRRFDVEATDMWGGARTWQTWHPCIGTRASRCPEWWNLNEPSQPKLSFDPSVLPEGIVEMDVTAYDAVLRKSTTTNTITVRIDHAAPTIKLSGTITEQATLGTELPGYTVRVDASDGVPNSKVASEARSGVASISEWVDGKKTNTRRAVQRRTALTSTKGKYQRRNSPRGNIRWL